MHSFIMIVAIAMLLSSFLARESLAFVVSIRAPLALGRMTGNLKEME